MHGRGRVTGCWWESKLLMRQGWHENKIVTVSKGSVSKNAAKTKASHLYIHKGVPAHVLDLKAWVVVHPGAGAIDEGDGQPLP